MRRERKVVKRGGTGMIDGEKDLPESCTSLPETAVVS